MFIKLLRLLTRSYQTMWKGENKTFQDFCQISVPFPTEDFPHLLRRANLNVIKEPPGYFWNIKFKFMNNDFLIRNEHLIWIFALLPTAIRDIQRFQGCFFLFPMFDWFHHLLDLNYFLLALTGSQFLFGSECPPLISTAMQVFSLLSIDLVSIILWHESHSSIIGLVCRIPCFVNIKGLHLENGNTRQGLGMIRITGRCKG